MVQLDVFEMPIYYKNAYFLGWLQGTPFNKQKLRLNFDAQLSGIYEAKGTYDWYFIENQHDLMTSENLNLVKEFYRTNFKNVSFKTNKYIISNHGVYWKLKISFNEFNRSK
jgi:hypothetical protein